MKTFFFKVYSKAEAAAEKCCAHPSWVLLFFMLFISLFYTVQCSLLQNVLGLDVLETISWGAQKALGHAKHPPLSGWLGYAVSKLGGHRDWIMYLAAQSCMAISVAYVYRCGKLFFDKYTAGTAALLLYFLFYYNPSETRFCTYPLETALVPAASFYFFQILRSNKIQAHLLLTLLCAAGIMNKYSFFLVMAAWSIIFFRNKENLRLLKSIKPYLSLVLLTILLLPHLNWLYNNDFICFKHVGNRLADTFSWYVPFVTAGTAFYPYVMLGILLLLLLLPDFKTRPVKTPDKDTGINALLIGGLPSAILILLACCGNDIIMMWFSTMASFSGIALIAFLPKTIDKKFFSRTALLLFLFCIGMMTGTTIDLLTSSRVRIHSKPQDYTVPATEFYQRHAAGAIPVVAGPRFEVTLLENYLPYRPSACELDDPVSFDRCKEKILRSGALLIGKEEKFARFLKDLNAPAPKFQKVTFQYKAPWGRKRRRSYQLAYLPPQQEKKTADVPAKTK